MDETIFKTKDAKSNFFITSIKSSFILKIIISFLKIENVLNLIIYNKQLQKKFGYNIEDYKEKSGKYRIYNKCGRGQVYILNTKIKIFEGEYLNGKRNGKGKEYYDDGKLKFEGEYLNGERNGKGKEYYRNDKLELEKEYLNSKINRKVIEYFNDSVFFDKNSSFGGDKSLFSKSIINTEKKYFDNKLKNEEKYFYNNILNFDGKSFDNLNLKFEEEYSNEIKGKSKENNDYNVKLKFEGE